MWCKLGQVCVTNQAITSGNVIFMDSSLCLQLWSEMVVQTRVNIGDERAIFKRESMEELPEKVTKSEPDCAMSFSSKSAENGA